jgi:hypothetical protein
MSTTTVHMIKIDGQVGEFPAYMAAELGKRGYLVVVNPKRNYYIEHDQTLPSYKKTTSTVEMNEDDSLEGELI